MTMRSHGSRLSGEAKSARPKKATGSEGKKAPEVRRRTPKELRTAVLLLGRLKELPGARKELVEQIKREIEAGIYETPERLEAAVEALMEELDLEA